MPAAFSRDELVTPSGIRLSILRWPGSGLPLYLMHATGFCGALWDPIACALQSSTTPRAMDARGHGSSDHPDTDYPWSIFAEDLLHWIREEDQTQVFAIGHSSGATAVLLAAAEEPERFARLLLIDPVLLHPPSERDEEERQGGFGLAERTKRRRGVFSSREAIRDAYRERFPFSGFRDDVVELYLEHGVRERADGSLELACPPDIERRIYLGTVAVDPWAVLPKIRTPTRILIPVLTGIRADLQERLPDALPHAQIERVPGTHFIALEQPDVVIEHARSFFA
jgi:pimeloyl-ACP methyl ester carboxylesterase